MEQRPAQRQALRHPARVRGDPLVADPQPEALEQHPRSLAPLGHAVETAEEVEVLERGELAVDERLVREEAEPAAVDTDLERPARGCREAREQAEERRLARPIRSGDDEGSVPRQVEVDGRERARRRP